MNLQIITTVQIGLIYFLCLLHKISYGTTTTVLNINGTVLLLYNFADDLDKRLQPFIIGNILIYQCVRDITFKITKVFWFICGRLIIMIIYIFPQADKGI